MPGVEHFRGILEAERALKLTLIASLRAEIAAATAARQDSNVDDEHDPEGATIAFELSQAAALTAQSDAGLAAIDAALGRIDAGTYGLCAVCGDAIAAGRLEARPWTPYCITHASAGRNA